MSARYSKGIIAVDLDGTLAKHYWPEDGAYDPLRIGDPVPAMVARIKGWLAEGREVCIFTARVYLGGSVLGHTETMVEAVRIAIERWCFDVFGVYLFVTCEKSFRISEIWDDRAVRVRADEGVPCCAQHLE